MQIRIDDLTGPEIRELLEEHLRNMREISPPCSVHALDLTALQKPEITFYTVWDGAELLGCGALKQLDPTHGEIKSMRTAMRHRRRGVGRVVLTQILNEARARGYHRVSLETGSLEAFIPAHQLYRSFGFTSCGPFGDYQPDVNSLFFTLELSPSSALK